ncbi:MAG: GatB/YqeY domain-containing protein [Candidatus Marinimicrobia bacterium]|nr:GatB/YqeY domain-containing protein [Candidatus Neomarinimicrobiota bacterium]
MGIKERLQRDLVEAMKKKDILMVSVIRMLKNGIKQKEIELKRDLSNDEVINVLNHAVKQRKEAIEAYEKAGREDMAERELRELEIIQTYLPEKLSQEELIKIIDQVIKEVGASSMKDMSKVMPRIMQIVKGRADGSEVQKIVRSKLAG